MTLLVFLKEFYYSFEIFFTLFAYENMIRYDHTLVDLKSNVFVLCTNV